MATSARGLSAAARSAQSVRRCGGLLAIAALLSLVAACNTTVYYPDGKVQAKIPWHQETRFESTGTLVISKPAPGFVDGVTTAALTAIDKSPEVIGRVVDVFASRPESQAMTNPAQQQLEQ